jgi:hypothetical protein
MRSIASGRETASAGNDAVQVGMVVQGLSPGMQHGDRSDLGAEVARVGGDVAQRVGGRAECGRAVAYNAKSGDFRCKTLFQKSAERQAVRAWVLPCSFEQTVR